MIIFSIKRNLLCAFCQIQGIEEEDKVDREKRLVEDRQRESNNSGSSSSSGRGEGVASHNRDEVNSGGSRVLILARDERWLRMQSTRVPPTPVRFFPFPPAIIEHPLSPFLKFRSPLSASSSY